MNRVLVLEEDKLLRNLAVEMLRIDGLEVVGLARAELHAHTASAAAYGAVVIGCSRSDALGLAACAELRRCASCVDTPVVLIAHGEDRHHAHDGDRLAHYIDLGVSYVVRHPLSVQLLAQRVRTVLGRFERMPNRERALAQHLCQHLEFHPEVLGHGQRVAVLASGFASWLGCDEGLVRAVHAAGLVHDIGKITVPRDILAKPFSLSGEEYARLCLHADYGAKLCRLFGMPERVCELVYRHHERHDGSGYPHGLAGRAIKREFTILSLADAFDALCEERVYRGALSRGEAQRVMSAEIGRGLWEPQLASQFFEYVERKVAVAL